MFVPSPDLEDLLIVSPGRYDIITITDGIGY